MATRLVADTAREIGRRAIHIKVSPRPTLYDTSQILKVLQGYGEVVMFRNMKYEPLTPAANTILAIFRTPQSASRLIESSPLEVTLEQKADHYSPNPLQTPFIIPGHHEQNYYNAKAATPAERHETTADASTNRHFTLKMGVSLLDHGAYIKRQHYYGDFAIDTNSPISEDLKKTVPCEGLSVIAMNAPERPPGLTRIDQKKLSGLESLAEIWQNGLESTKTES